MIYRYITGVLLLVGVGCQLIISRIGAAACAPEGESRCGEGNTRIVCREGFEALESCGEGLCEEGPGGASCVICGNGALNQGEQCDDGNLIPGDGCRADCTTELCGDGSLDIGEACDDGNSIDGDTCDSNCALPGCGNGAVVAPEQCDDGNLIPGDGCREDCTAELCGDNILDPNEECDDGNTTNFDGCEADCTLACGQDTGAFRAALDRAAADGNCYLLFQEQREWPEAKVLCEQINGHLAIISDLSENLLVDIAAGNNGDSWIGFQDQDPPNGPGEANNNPFGFQDVLGNFVTFDGFNGNEPNNQGDEDCVEFNPNTQGWNDSRCTDKNFYMCELEL